MRNLATLLAAVLLATTIVSVAQPARADNVVLTCKSGFPEVEFGHSSQSFSQLTYLEFQFTKWYPSGVPLQNGQCSMQGGVWQLGDPGCLMADVGQVDTTIRDGQYTISFPEHRNLNALPLSPGTIYHFKVHLPGPGTCWRVDW